MAFTPNALGQPRTAGSYVSNATYHAGGQIKSFDRQNGVNRSVDVDAAGRIWLITDRKGTANRFKQEYTYDSESNIENIYDRVQSAYSITDLTYDEAGRLEAGTGNWGNTRLTYDDTGNITMMTLGTNTLNYTYDNSNRLTAISGSVARTFGYDARGNVSSNGQRSFTYNNDNQMVASGTISVDYDGNGMRTRKTVGSSTDLFVYSPGGQLLYKRAANGVGTNYVYLGSELVAKVSSSLRYTSTDLLGSVAMETSSTGAVSKRYHYEPFGRALETGQADDPGYTGHLYDDDLGLNYMKARYYDPLIGRFYSNDPVGYTATNPVMSFNRYLYVNDNPYKYVDPDGEFAWMLVGAGASALINVGYQLYTTGEIDGTQVVVAAALGALGVNAAAAISVDVAATGLSGAGAVAMEIAGNAGAGATLAGLGTTANALIDGLQGDSDGSVNFDQFASSVEAGGQFGAFGSGFGQGLQAVLKNTSGTLQGAAGEISDTLKGVSDAVGTAIAGILETASEDRSDK